MGSRYALGIDVGGTFTDFTLVDLETREATRHKHLTTYPDASVGVMAGFCELLASTSVDPGSIGVIVHSTTLVTNAIVQRRGVVTGLLTTRGFRHVLDLGNEQRYDTYDLFLTYPDPLVPPELRAEVNERTLADGTVLRPLAIADAVGAAETLVTRGAQSLAIAFLHSYANPAHEEEAAGAIRRRFPGLPVSLSSQVAPIIGEWERLCTTAADACVRPLVDEYLRRMEQELQVLGFQGRLLVTQSTGGAVTVDVACRYPIRLLESGPASGVLAAADVGRQLHLEDFMAFDMGGTTAKLCLVEGGNPRLSDSIEVARVHRFKRGSGLPIRAPSIDLIEIGAGGGSYAYRDGLGLLRVGPQSAGADPGPVCYGRGGTTPTVTDASLVLGYYDPDAFLGGRMRLDLEAAREAVSRLGAELGLDVVTTAWRIHEIVNHNMAAAARTHALERGRDPSRLPLVASGGAGPCHATAVARALGCRRVVLPPGAGTFSATGCVRAPRAFVVSRTRLWPLAEEDWTEINRMLEAMAKTCLEQLRQEGDAPGRVHLSRMVDMRLRGQIHTIRIPIPDGRLNGGARGRIAETFHDEYERLFARSHRHLMPECVNWYVVGEVPSATPPARHELHGTGAASFRRRWVDAYFPEAGGFVRTRVFNRSDLLPGTRVEGPAIICESESTAILRPGDVATVDEARNLLVEVGS